MLGAMQESAAPGFWHTPLLGDALLNHGVDHRRPEQNTLILPRPPPRDARPRFFRPGEPLRLRKFSSGSAGLHAIFISIQR